MHIAVFLQHYHTPDCPTAARPYALVHRLAEEHRVTLITTAAWRDTRQAQRYAWVPPGVELVELDVPYDNSMSAAQRAVSFARYAGRALLYGLQMSRPDLLLGSSTPLTAAAAAATVGRLRGVPWIFEVRDLWPDFPIQMGALPDCGLHRLLRAGEATLYRSADHVVTVSPDMEAHVRVRAPGASVTTLGYGADLSLVEEVTSHDQTTLASRFSLDRPFLVVYAGTFGRANAIPTLLETARMLDDRPDVLFAFAGQGYHESRIRRAADRRDNVRLLPPLPYPEALTLFSLADLSLVPFVDRPVLAANAPSKFYDSLATGTPVVVTNPGWTKRFVERCECGWYVPPESPEHLARCLRTVVDAPEHLEAYSANAEGAGQQAFARGEIMDRYADLVRQVGRMGGADS